LRPIASFRRKTACSREPTTGWKDLLNWSKNAPAKIHVVATVCVHLKGEHRIDHPRKYVPWREIADDFLIYR
jgi:hypothetical protein